MNKPTLIFIFSLPRSGSTLLQHLLAAHNFIDTASEPFFLLHFLESTREGDIYSTYSHQNMVWAIEDFANYLPGGYNDYLEELHEFAVRLYARASGKDAKYFLDKTPSYHLVVEQIIEIFPEAKFIFLWRNPLSVISSMLSSWQNGRWNIYHSEFRLFKGFSNLISAFEKYQDQVCSIKYEEMILNTDQSIKNVFDYLELPFDPVILDEYSKIELHGRVQYSYYDKLDYQTIRQEPIAKWKDVINNPLRKMYCRRYLHWIGQERLAIMGYDLDDLLNQLNAVPFDFQYFFSDLYWIPYGKIYPIFEPRIIKHNIQALFNGKRVYPHT